MFAQTTQLIFCGYLWTISVNDGLYRCKTQFSEEECTAVVTCQTGEGDYDRATGIATAIEHQAKLHCDDFVHFTKLNIYNKFAAAISCQKS